MLKKRIAVEVFCPEDVENIMQDVFEEAFKNREQSIFDTKHKNPVLSWLRGITDNKIADHKRNFLGRTQRKSVSIPLGDVQDRLSRDHSDPARLVTESDTLTSLKDVFSTVKE